MQVHPHGRIELVHDEGPRDLVSAAVAREVDCEAHAHTLERRKVDHPWPDA